VRGGTGGWVFQGAGFASRPTTNRLQSARAKRVTAVEQLSAAARSCAQLRSAALSDDRQGPSPLTGRRGVGASR